MDQEKKLNINLFVGTPCYNSMLHSDYLQSIITFYNSKIPFTIMTLGNESLITRGRNQIISYFYKNTQCTHLLFLDSDIFLHGDDLIKLLLHEKDVIGAPVALKGKHINTGSSVYNVGDHLGEEGTLIKTNRLGTAVFILSRKAVNALVEKAKKDNDIYHPNPHTRGDTDKNVVLYDIFKTGVYRNQYLPEDFYVCKTLMDLGFDIYVDPTVRTRHNGMFVFE
ncbi:MAG: hypothetical protein ACFFG0_00715 [Candidatus Thorarchaeota archaeon]